MNLLLILFFESISFTGSSQREMHVPKAKSQKYVYLSACQYNAFYVNVIQILTCKCNIDSIYILLTTKNSV